MTNCFIGLGSNLEEPIEQLRSAIDKLETIEQTSLIKVSQLYRSDPVGPPGQPDYINAVAQLDTDLAPEALLDQLQRIETEQGRLRAERWGPRTIDLDILLYGNRQIDSERLSIPHPEMHNRSFVLIPLYEIAPNLCLPDGTPLASIIEKSPLGSLDRITI